MSCVKYEVECRSDFLTGMYLTARIPESDIDENALLTIQDDCPDFILPFNRKSVNGQMEFTYKVGSLCKLQYFYGDISHEEYFALWRGILRPLLECKDWFMSPSSFILSTQYLYYDKNKKTVVYVYIPSYCGCSGYDTFSEMAVDIAKNIKVSDPVLENKVLRCIVNGFDPKEFLDMLQDYADSSNAKIGAGEVLQICDPAEEEEPESEEVYKISLDDEPENLRWHSIGKKRGKERSSHSLFAGKKKSGKPRRNGYKNTVPGALVQAARPVDAYDSGTTQETKVVFDGTGLRCIGRAQLPQAISVDISEGGMFSIGRYDASIGKKQSSFEFEAKTKAVSRRHAVIERSGTEYRIIDLASSAGTFINDRKLPPNTPATLEPGCRVSFGNLGADYVWEEC